MSLSWVLRNSNGAGLTSTAGLTAVTTRSLAQLMV